MLYAPSYSGSHALIVGINEYQHAPPLAHATNDAEAVAKVLIERFNFPEANVLLLKDKRASAGAIRAAFLKYAQIGADDRVLFFFAGHGHTVAGRRGDTGFLIPFDGKLGDLATFIRWDELTRNSELIPAKHILFLMDACYGGLALKRKALEPGSMRFLKDMLQRYSRQVITAGKADEPVSDADGPRAGHSIFTAHLLDALEGAAATTNGIVTANSVMTYVYEKVGGDPHSQQTPHFGFVDGDGDFIFDMSPIEKLKEGDEGKDLMFQVALPAVDGSAATRSVSETMKDLISDFKQQIHLDDFVTSHLRRAIEALSADKFPVPSVFSKEELEKQIHRYETAVQDLRTICILLARWGNEDQMVLLEKIFSRLAEMEKPGSGFNIFIGLAWHPLQILAYTTGISALSAKKVGPLAAALLTRVRERGRTGAPAVNLIEVLTDGVVKSDEGFKMLPGHERHLVPRSEYLFKFLQPELEDQLFLGRSYESYFDDFEILWALSYADIRKKKDSHFWAPLGRFAWKHRNGYDSPLGEFRKDAEQQNALWPPLRVGFFSSSIDRFREIEKEFEELLARYPLR
jgi:hypothetical protein